MSYMLKGVLGHVLSNFKIVELNSDIACFTTHVRTCLQKKGGAGFLSSSEAQGQIVGARESLNGRENMA